MSKYLILGAFMLKRIESEINDFTHNIKTIEGHDELLVYMNSNIYASVKLLVFASKTFSLFSKVILFFTIVSTGFLLSSSIGVFAISSSLLLATTLFLFVLLLIYISHYKKVLISSIEKVKKSHE